VGHARPSGDTSTPAEPVADPDAAVNDFASFWTGLSEQARACNLSRSKWADRASALAGRQHQTGRPEHKPFPAKTLYDRAQKGRRVEWGEACWFVSAIPGLDGERWKAAWERAERQWLATHGTSAVAPASSPEPTPARAEGPPASPDDVQPDTTPPPGVVRWWQHILVGGVCVVALASAVIVGRSAVATSSEPPHGATAASSSLYAVCADSLTVRRDPKRVNDTEVVAELKRGDTFRVEQTRGPTWSYGESDGSLGVRGWVQTRWLKPTC
jgi:hypothetical protein